ncbi:MAG TPA: LysR family transcriptional regulator [Gammaproteobacteria bacterium]|nr:LysR family transcriptional regulator [Gammaproteobacteria bacterium]
MFLELRHLRSLLAIHETGNLSRAAQRLHLTQSALTHQVKALEHYFGTPLFYRRRRPLQFTPAGHRLLELARAVLPQVEGTERALRALAEGRSGRMYLTIECHACFEWLLPLLDHYRRACPEVEVDIRLGMSFDPLPSLLRGDIDLVITSDPVDMADVLFEPLFAYEARLVVPSGHRLARRRRVAPADLAAETLITYPVARRRLDVFTCFLEPAGVEPAAVRQVELTAMILQLVAAGRGVAVLPDWVLQAARPSGLRSLPLGREGLAGTLYAAIRQQERATPYLDRFIHMARRHAETRARGLQAAPRK